MADFVSLLLDAACEVVPGERYNKVLEAILTSAPEGEAPHVYEMVLPERASWESFRDQAFPPFVRYLKRRCLDPEGAEGVRVALFFKDRCYLLEGPRLLGVLREMDDLGGAALHSRIARWLAG